ncbi:uncharacterized protein LY89DRAFT_742398 [Mollisia scopiformis]|uniref:PARP catalytic domain-containing protein n=1 Tax=Mollisia scopiformis TaxID=149040 RepID=A0A132B6S3_MOLSC|nr:uncharacterized protein LY89DRAFT_742398 [Mollisia scopiformis]KUJ08105.1 hypothetical protein LY89DRAFT_742398 [Mollisia scopiformis]
MAKAGPSKPKTRSQTASYKLPATFDPTDFAKLKVAGLKARLDKQKIFFHPGANKPELQATYVLCLMGVFVPNKRGDAALVEKVAGWCKMRVEALHDELEDRKLVKGANRWECIGVLVAHEMKDIGSEEGSEYEEPPKKKTKFTLRGRGKGKKEMDVEESPDENVKKSKTKKKRKQKKAVVEDESSDEDARETKRKDKLKKRLPVVVEESSEEELPSAKANGKGKETELDKPAEQSTSKGTGKEIATPDSLAQDGQPESSTAIEKPFKHPTPAVMNLLISTIFADLAKPETILITAYPGIPCKTKDEVVNHFNTFQAFQTQDALSKILDKPSSDADTLLSWIASNYGADIIPAEGDLKIPGFANEVTQFIIAKPRADLEELWKKEYRKDKETSILLFHGSSYVNLQSILRRGFLQSVDTGHGVGVFVAACPTMSNGYATSGSNGYTHLENGTIATASPVARGSGWKMDPFASRRLMLGCEATGKGRPQATGAQEVHVITNMKSVMARYIFLIPESQHVVIPTRAQVGPTMITAFDKIRDGLEDEAPNEISPKLLPALKKKTTPDFKAMNLILSSVFSDISLHGKPKDCPFKTSNDVLAAFEHIPSFTSQKELEQILGDTSNPAHVGHDAERQRLWKRCFKIDSEKSMMLFHGTGLQNLQSILRIGFKAAGDTRYGPGLFMGLELETSLGYVGDRKPLLQPWKSDTYHKRFGLLFGCEVTDNGLPLVHDYQDQDDNAVVINRLRAIVPRYLFLVPLGAEYWTTVQQTRMPPRNEVNDPMMKAFEKIRALIKEKSAGSSG